MISPDDRATHHDGSPYLNDKHLADLAKSGITPEHAALRGYETVTTRDRLSSLRPLPFSARAVKRVPGLLIPLLGVEGQIWGHQFRPDREERPDKPGELQKYETPTEQRNGLDIPPGLVPDLLQDPSERLWIPEGSKKADCAVLHGLTAISVSGVWNFRGKNRFGGVVRVADWNDIPLNGREIVITYDGDIARKLEVRRAMVELAEWLKTKRAQVCCVWLPDTDRKTGLDDYLMDGHTVDDLMQLVRPFDFKLDGDGATGRRSASSTLVDLARDTYSLGVTPTGTPFGCRRLSHVAMILRGSRSLRAELACRYYEEHGTVPSQSALADACTVLEGYACQGEPRPLHLRVAKSEVMGNVYIDMGDADEHVISIFDGEWHISRYQAEGLFQRTGPMLAMPMPVGGGDLEKLWGFVPVETDDRPLILAWLVSVLVQPDVAHTILALMAEHGSIKTTTTKCLVNLIDPSSAPVRKPPSSADAWVTAANATLVIGIDNVSGTIPAWLSDCMCRAATGDGDIRRQLYTDSDVTTFSYRRAVVFNGVDIVVTQPDLADRLLRVRLPRVINRRTDRQVADDWKRDHPHILGGLLDLAAKVHDRLPTIDVDDMPRMADYAQVLACVDEVLDTKGLDRYRKLVQRIAEDTLDAPFIAALVKHKYTADKLSAKDILIQINGLSPGQSFRKGWPMAAQSVTAQLTKHAPALRIVGWTVEHDGGSNHDHMLLWTITPPSDEGEQC
jgi:hypothetical protein